MKINWRLKSMSDEEFRRYLLDNTYYFNPQPIRRDGNDYVTTSTSFVDIDNPGLLLRLWRRIAAPYTLIWRIRHWHWY